MAFFQDAFYVKQLYHSVFDQVHQPGKRAPNAGIYRCEQCGYEEAVMEGERLPADGHTHSIVNQGPVRWRVVVIANERPD